ncbi:MAG: amidohydrolase family protein [Armatimonadota bacterium]
MAGLPFVDCNCEIGTRANRHSAEPWRLQQYKDDFEYYDIMAAVVYHAVAKDYCAEYGNKRLMREIGDDLTLIPQWVVLPHHTGEMPPPPELVDDMLNQGVRSARIFPSHHRYNMDPYIVGPLLTELEHHRIPLFVDISEISGIGEAAEICQRHPTLPLVVCGVSWGIDRQLYPALAKAPNLYIETHAHQGHRAYERFVREFGDDRLLFGTDLPRRSPGAARMMTDYEDIPDESRRKIAGENIMRLLSRVEGATGRPLPDIPEPPEHPDDDPLVAQMRTGEVITDHFILDAHGHLGHPGCMGVHVALPYNDADNLVGTMNRVGIDICCFSPWMGIITGDSEANDISLQAVNAHPDRLMAYGCNNPNYPDQHAAEMERIFESDRVIGAKPYVSRQGVPYYDPRRKPTYEWANENEKPVLYHGQMNREGGMSPDLVREMAPKYPKASHIVAHSGSSWKMAEGMIEACNECDNVFAEITYTSILYGFIEYFCENSNPNQLLFGTDCVMRDAAPQFGWVAWARIPYEQKLRIIAANMADILKMPEDERVNRVPEA